MQKLASYLSRDARGNHEAVVDGLDLVHVVLVDPGIKHLIQGVQEDHHLGTLKNYQDLS